MKRFARLVSAIAEFFNLSKASEIVMEPVVNYAEIRNELLPDPCETLPKRTSPFAVLRPEYRIVEFDYRHALLDELIDWCSWKNDQHVGWKLVTGETGRGKTRLMVELCAEMNNASRGDWIAGFLNIERFSPRSEKTNEDAINRAYDVLFQSPKPLLIVVDYAERHSKIVKELLVRSLRRDDQAKPGVTKIIFVARGRSDIWNEIFSEPKQLRGLGSSDLQEINLEPVAHEYSAQEQFAKAVERFAAHRGENIAAPTLDFAGLARAGEPPDIGLIHMLALETVLSAGTNLDRQNSRPQRDNILHDALEREQTYWAELAADRNIAPELQQIEILTAAAARLTQPAQQGAIATAADARRVLALEELLEDQSAANLNALANLFREIYPGIGYVNGVVPDLLGDYLITQVDV